MLVEIGTEQPLLCNIAMYEAASLEGNIGRFKLIAVDALGKGKLTGILPVELDSKDAD